VLSGVATKRLTLGVKEVSDALGISVSMVRKLIRENKLASLTIGDRRMVRDEDLRGFLLTRKHGGGK